MDGRRPTASLLCSCQRPASQVNSPQSLRLPLFTQFIASWRHHSAIDDFGCSVADKYCCKHICLILCQLLKRHDLKKFSVSSNLSDNTADSCRRSILHDNLTSLIQIILSLFAGGIIKTDSHISTCCSCQALLDQFPRCHPSAVHQEQHPHSGLPLLR